MWRLIYISVYSLFGISLIGQNLDSTLSLGETLYAGKQYDQAIYFYERARYFSPQELEVNILYRMGECYRLGGEAPKSLDYYDRVYFSSKETELQQQALLAKVQALMQMREFNLALAEIFASSTQDSEIQQRFDFYEGICHFANKDFEQSFYSFKAAAGEDNLKMSALDLHYSDTSSLYRPRPMTAKKLSYFFPGLGQLYAGDFRNGINSAVLNVAFVALAINVGINYSLFDAFIAVFPWLNRYYLGGTDKAKMIAEEKLLKNRQEFYLEVLRILAQESKGSPTRR